MSDVVVTTPAESPLPAGVHQSRWGYHNCSWEVFKKLKALSAAYHKTLRQAATWKRWDRKAPRNRVARPRVRDAAGRVVGYGEPTPLPEPKVCSLFATHEGVTDTWGPLSGGHHLSGFHKDGVTYFRLKLTDNGVLGALNLARTPAPTPAAVVPLPLAVAEVDRLYALLEAQRAGAV